MPRQSKSNHPLALLRRKLDLLQKEFADLAGCSLATIQSIELRRLELSRNLAARISERTGVSMDWLLNPKAKAPIPAAESRGYRFVEFEKSHFDLAQTKGIGRIGEKDFELMLEIGKSDLEAVFRSAREQGPEQERVCFHRISKGLDNLAHELEAEFGKDLDMAKANYHDLVRRFIGTEELDVEGLNYEPIPQAELASKDIAIQDDE